MRRIGVATFARSEYSSCLPLLKAIQADSDLSLQLFVSGAHLSPEFGDTVQFIEADGFKVDFRIETLLSSDTPEGIAKSIGLGVLGFAQTFSTSRPDILLIIGDRLELLSVACAALAFNIPLAHVSGGDVTEGAVDNQVRHAITKMSHIHFVAMQTHAERLLQMGEEPWRVVVSGDPALDLIYQINFLKKDALEQHLKIDLRPPVLLITYHPTTLNLSNISEEIDNLLSALDRVTGTMIFSHPNSDAQSQVILEKIKKFISLHPGTHLFSNLGQQNYYSLMLLADLMIGNSSSGIWEAPSFKLPVVNIGERQKGRLRMGNVIDVDGSTDAIYAGILLGLGKSFQDSLSTLQNPYGDGRAVPRMLNKLKNVPIDMNLLQKKFIDMSIDKGENL